MLLDRIDELKRQLPSYESVPGPPAGAGRVQVATGSGRGHGWGRLGAVAAAAEDVIENWWRYPPPRSAGPRPGTRIM